jgi:hypothetical protein
MCIKFTNTNNVREIVLNKESRKQEGIAVFSILYSTVSAVERGFDVSFVVCGFVGVLQVGY